MEEKMRNQHLELEVGKNPQDLLEKLIQLFAELNHNVYLGGEFSFDFKGNRDRHKKLIKKSVEQFLLDNLLAASVVDVSVRPGDKEVTISSQLTGHCSRVDSSAFIKSVSVFAGV